MGTTTGVGYGGGGMTNLTADLDGAATVLFATDLSRWLSAHNFCLLSRLQPGFSKSLKTRLKPAANPPAADSPTIH